MWLLNMGVQADDEAVLHAVRIGGQVMQAILASGARLPAPDHEDHSSKTTLYTFGYSFVFGKWYMNLRLAVNAQWLRWHAPCNKFKKLWVLSATV